MEGEPKYPVAIHTCCLREEIPFRKTKELFLFHLLRPLARNVDSSFSQSTPDRLIRPKKKLLLSPAEEFDLYLSSRKRFDAGAAPQSPMSHGRAHVVQPFGLLNIRGDPN